MCKLRNMHRLPAISVLFSNELLSACDMCTYPTISWGSGANSSTEIDIFLAPALIPLGYAYPMGICSTKENTCICCQA